MDEQSQDQAIEETQLESQDQAQTEETGEGNDQDLVEVNGEKLSIDELKKGYMRSADYTRKTQRLAQDKSKSLEDIKDSNPELYNAVVQLREAWVATKDDISETIKEQLEEIESKKSSEQSAKQFFENNPDLEKSQKAILELSKNTGMTPEEVAIHYWFADSDKLQKGKKEVKGKFAPKPKSYWELSRQEKDSFINQSANIPDNIFYRK